MKPLLLVKPGKIHKYASCCHDMTYNTMCKIPFNQSVKHHENKFTLIHLSTLPLSQTSPGFYVSAVQVF